MKQDQIKELRHKLRILKEEEKDESRNPFAMIILVAVMATLFTMVFMVVGVV